MALFGEIVIPGSRALFEDETEERFDENTTPLEWDNNVVPNTKIDTLIVIENAKLTNVARICLLGENKRVCELLGTTVYVHKIADDKYMVLIDENEKIPHGEITDKLIPWIEKSKLVLAFNAAPAITYQTNSSEEKPSCFIRALCTGSCDQLHASKLEAPNLATGVTAGVLSYCHHMGLSAVLYMCYLEPTPLDSISTEPILTLCRELNIPILHPYKVKVINNDSNLYM